MVRKNLHHRKRQTPDFGDRRDYDTRHPAIVLSFK
jgi:hypothetical protein